MKKLSPFLFAVFCLQSSLFSNSSQGSSSLTFEENLKVDQILVQKVHPGAWFWFQKMIEKYPQAELGKVQFCVSDCYESGAQTIYFPKFQLKRMDMVFEQADVYGATDEMFAEFAEDEYLLLHEAKHVLSKDIENAELVAAATVGGSCVLMGSLIYLAFHDQIEISSGIAGSAATIGAAYAGLCAYARFQEGRADNFANQNSDARALRAGAYWFKRLNTFMNFENIAVPEMLNSISKIIQDPMHPSPKSREKKALIALALRFGQTA